MVMFDNDAPLLLLPKTRPFAAVFRPTRSPYRVVLMRLPSMAIFSGLVETSSLTESYRLLPSMAKAFVMIGSSCSRPIGLSFEMAEAKRKFIS